MTDRKIFKGGEFLIADIDPKDVFTPEDFTKEHQMVLKATQDFVKKELTDNAELIEEKDEKRVRKWFKQAGEIGINAPDTPEDLGGEGMDKISSCLVAEAMGGAHSFAVSHVCQTGIGSLPIVLFGNDEQKKKYIPKLATGEYIGAYCLTESGAGSDAMNAATTATLSSDGKHYLLNGEKIFITNGAWADVFTVFAKVDGEKFTGFIVEKGFEGFSTGPEEKKMGIKGSSTVSVILKDCKVPVGNVLFEIGKGHKIAFNVLNIGRYKLGASATGGAKMAVGVAAKYANEREQFGVKISSFGMIRSKLADMATKIYMAESLTYRLAAAIDDKMDTLDEEEKKSGTQVAKSIEEYSVECAIAKVYGSEMLDFVVDEMVQIYGGNGYIAEYPAERAYRDSRINRIFEGTNEINRLVITATIIKNAMKGKLPLLDAVGNVAAKIKSTDPASENFKPALAKQDYMLKTAKNILLLTVDTVAKKLMETIQDQQEVIALLADIIIEIFVMESGLIRAKKFMAKKGEEKALLYTAAASLYIADTMPKISVWAKQVFAFAEVGDEFVAHIEDIEKITRYEPDNTIQLKRVVADSVVKKKRYPY
jgi:alkylation response protein AidB-like acyl-CoA dehydrogenase